jgi:hypothetical protein
MSAAARGLVLWRVFYSKRPKLAPSSEIDASRPA